MPFWTPTGGTHVAPTGLIGAAVTILPAMGVLWYLLKRYEDYFDDARVFFSLAVGFFAGIIIGFLETAVFPFNSGQFIQAAGAAYAFSYFVAGYALLETLAKTVVLGSRGYRNRKDTPYYGVPLGLGMGAMMSMLFVAQNLGNSRLFDSGTTGPDLVALAFIVLFSLGVILTHGATGAWVGHAITHEGSIWRGLLMGGLWLIPMQLMRWIWPWDLRGAAMPAVVMLLYGLGVAYLTRKRILDNVVPPEIRDALRRERRREARRDQRDP